MGRHSIRGVLTGKELNVTRTVPKWYRPRHAIGGGEYTTVPEVCRWPNGVLGAIVSWITYSIAPHGPHLPHMCDRRCHKGQGCPDTPVGNWYRGLGLYLHSRSRYAREGEAMFSQDNVVHLRFETS